MQQDHAGTLRRPDQLGHTVENLVAIARRVFAHRNEERENTNKGRLQRMGYLDSSLESGQVWSEVAGDWDFANRRADRRDFHPAGVQRSLNRRDLGVGQVQDVLTPDAAKLQMTDGLAGQRL